MNSSPSFWTDKCVCRGLWKQGSEKERRKALIYIIEASHYKLSDESNPNIDWPQ